ncbi:von Willebrand factor D and EGF domain-containing protein-like [Saccostrea cucullata]|uniref:von Willebrand factor D and EGF domain-containing protein-like n=1 Tax=Saccostrea cuccullata TaxID=36930 RepID=UPI002ED55E6E
MELKYEGRKLIKWKLVLLCVLYFQVVNSNECTTYILKKDEVRRSIGVLLTPEQTSISDNFMSDGWYRFESEAGNDMPLTAPTLLSCGTMYPIWLQGTIPNVAEGVVNRTACMVTFLGQCTSTLGIKIRNCGEFRVYYLVKTNMMSSGYCIGDKVKCEEGFGSETGYSPGCASVPNITVTPNVVTSLEEGTSFFPNNPSLITVFKCVFDEPKNDSYLFDVHWFIDEDKVKVTRNQTFDSTSLWLYPEDWVNGHDLNMKVKCSVRVRFSSGVAPGKHQYSADFNAGIFPEKTEYIVAESETISINFNVTVPVGCIAKSFQSGCDGLIYLLTPIYQSSIQQCTNFSNSDVISFEENHCGILVKGLSWNSTVRLNVTGNVDNLINIADRETNIRLGTTTTNGMDPSRVWDNITMPDIKVYVSDKDFTIRHIYCKFWTDPRLRTFDGSHGSVNDVGEFVMYSHKKRNIKIHVMTRRCFLGSCSCGIAVRVENSIYIHHHCPIISNTFLQSFGFHTKILRLCDKQHMDIKDTGYSVTISLPTGTELNYWYSGSHFYSINILPSYFDVGNIEGICGNANLDGTDDFIPFGSSSPTNNFLTFTRSWRITNIQSTRSLFGPNVDLTTSVNTLPVYCSCSTEAKSLGDFPNHYTANCTITDAMVKCSKVQWNSPFEEACEGGLRRRRSIDNGDNIIETQTIVYDPDFDPDYIPVESNWTNGWTEESARSHCKDKINLDPSIEECDRHLDLSNMTSQAIEDCILDIRDSNGSTEWTALTVESIKDHCVSLMRRDERFYIVDNTTGQSVLNMFTSMACFNNCSGNGDCNGGECNCHSGYIGFDCSHSVTVPPDNTRLPGQGLCGERVRPCLKTNVMGYFLSEDIHVKYEHVKILTNGTQMITGTSISTASYQDSSLITITLPKSTRRKRATSSEPYATAFNIHLSYDAVHFGNSMTFFIYDEQCFSCNSTTAVCEYLDTCDNVTENVASTTNGEHSTTSQTMSYSSQANTNSDGTEALTNFQDASTTQQSIYTQHNTHQEKRKADGFPLLIVVGPLSAVVVIGIVVMFTIYKCKKYNETKRKVGQPEEKDNYLNNLFYHVSPVEKSLPPNQHVFDRSITAQSISSVKSSKSDMERAATPSSINPQISLVDLEN